MNGFYVQHTKLINKNDNGNKAIHRSFNSTDHTWILYFTKVEDIINKNSNNICYMPVSSPTINTTDTNGPMILQWDDDGSATSFLHEKICPHYSVVNSCMRLTWIWTARFAAKLPLHRTGALLEETPVGKHQTTFSETISSRVRRLISSEISSRPRTIRELAWNSRLPHYLERILPLP